MFPAFLLFLLFQNPAPTFEQNFRTGLEALASGDLVKARTSLEDARQSQPGNARVWVALAQTYGKLRESASAEAAADQAEKLGAKDPAVLHGLALYHSKRGSFARAAALEVRYAALAPQDREAIPRAMGLYLAAKQPKAVIEAAHGLTGWETRADIRNLLGRAYVLDEQFDHAASELHEAMRLSPYNEALIFDAANLDLQLERFDAAVSVLTEGRKQFDKSPQLELALGVAQYGLRRFPEAIDQFLKTIALAPDAEQPYIFLGKMLDQGGERLPEITARFVQLEQDKPQSYLGYLLHAKAVRAEGGESADPEPLLRKSVALDARQWETRFELGISLESQNDWAGAAKEFERAIELNPKEPAPHYRLARAYDRLGKPDLANAQRELHKTLTAKSENR
jgi:tetratricopeptide (TPR) repeat protein